MYARWNNISIAGISAVVPARIERISDLIQTSSPGEGFTIKRVAALAGLEQRHVASPEIYTADLAIAAGKELLNNLKWDPDSVNMLFLGTQSPDFLSPPTGYLVAAGLGFSEHCVVTDLISGCPGMIQLAWLAAPHLSERRRRALLLCGDTASKFVRGTDTGNKVLMGDGMSALALEYDENAPPISFNLFSYPDTDFAIAHYNSGYKKRSDKEFGGEMKGDIVTNFSHTKVPDAMLEHLKKDNVRVEELDVFFMHQPNKRILETIRKNLGIENERMPVVLSQYGNCCGASAPIAACSWGPENKKPGKAMFCVFGTGLSVASMLCEWDPARSFGITVLGKGMLKD